MDYKYTDERFREDEEGYIVKEVFVPSEGTNGEWMNEDDYKFILTCIEASMEDAERDWYEHGSF